MMERQKHLHFIMCVLSWMVLCLNQFASAQYMDFVWSDEFRYTNKKTGFFTEFVGTSFTNVYLLQRNIEKSKPYKDAKVMLVSLTKNALGPTEEKQLPLKGFPENDSQESLLDELDYLKTMVVDEKIVVFWRKLINTDSTRKEEIYAQTFRTDFKSDLSLRKVFEFVQNVEDRASVFDPTMCVVLSENETGRMVVGAEKYADSTLSFEYIGISSQLKPSTPKTVVLPQKPTSVPENLISEYELSSDGLIHIRSIAFYTIDELFYLDAKHAKTYPVLTVVNIASGAQKSVEFKTNFRTITDFSYSSSGGKTRAFGFFGDFSEDTSGIDNQGLFYADIDIATPEEVKVNYVYFERSVVNRLFPKTRKRKRRGYEIPSWDEVLATRFDIQHVTPMPDSSLVFFFTEQYNHTKTNTKSNLRGENEYSVQEFCTNKNVSAIRFSASGEIMWARSEDRTITYQGNNVSDIRVVYIYDDFIVLFGNELVKLSPPKGRKFQHLTDELTYYTFDANSGRAKELTTPVNEAKTEPENMKYLDPNSSVVIDDQVYFYKMRVKQHPLWTAANIVAFPTLYYTLLTGNTKVGKADFTVMKIMEGRRPRQRR